MSLPEQPDLQGTQAGPPLGGPLGAVGSLIYGAAIGWKNRRFDRGKGVVTFDRPVISVGNLSVGGTGKTPMVLHLARALTQAGHKPCVAMRGYRPAGQAGAGLEADEALAYRRSMRTLPIVAQVNRTLGLIELFGTEHGSEVDCVILDDGFQHRQIARQYDIVLVDATRPPFGDKLLPAGWLREPPESLRRAHAAVVTHAEALSRGEVEQLGARLREYLPKGVVAVASHAWAGLWVDGDQGEEPRGVEWLAGKRVYVACAIGNPEAFIAQARRAVGGSGFVVGATVLRDHAEFGPSVVAALKEALGRERADALLVTDKDWSKLMDVQGWPCPVARPCLELRFGEGGEQLVQAALGAVEGFKDCD